MVGLYPDCRSKVDHCLLDPVLPCQGAGQVIMPVFTVVANSNRLEQMAEPLFLCALQQEQVAQPGMGFRVVGL